jgi:hypothetical protein
VEFDRLFTISAFEGLRLLRGLLAEQPGLAIHECTAVLIARSPQASGYDLDAAVELHTMVRRDAPDAHVGFYRECVMAVMIQSLPAWAKVMTIGRGRFIKSIRRDEYRDIRSVFREAQLLADPPTMDDIRWWDEMKERVRTSKNLVTMERAREAERLSLEREMRELGKAGIDRSPEWTAIEDDTVGYDIKSYREIAGIIRPILIEVKSTIASPLRFNVSRNEWNQAASIGDAYRFHIWDLAPSPARLYEKSVEDVRPHIPVDSAQGEWTNVRVPVSSKNVVAREDIDWAA